jgi:hypothetical protein
MSSNSAPQGLLEEELAGPVETLKRRLEEILARPKVTYRDALEAVEAAQIIADLLRCKERALRLLEGDREGRASGEERAGDLSGLTLEAAAERVLREVGRPLHARDLGDTIKARGWQHPRSRNARPDQVVFQLAARLAKNPAFVRTAPNTFALTELGFTAPPKERPKPLVGIFAGGGDAAALPDGGEMLDEYFKDETNAPWS